MNLGDHYQALRKKLREGGVETPDLDARLLLAHVYGCAPDDVILKPEKTCPPAPLLDSYTERRLAGAPVSKIIGAREFYGLNFFVNEHVLDPRADTETLIDAVRPYLKGNMRILDLCTGSGCILTTLLTLQPGATGVAADVSAQALDVARDNFKRHAVDARIDVVQSHWLEGVTGTFDLIACNPPYIETGVIDSLAKDVRDFDPHLALDGGIDGLTPYKILFPQIRTRLNASGIAAFEIGATQAPDITRLAADAGLNVISVHHDLGGHARVVLVE